MAAGKSCGVVPLLSRKKLVGFEGKELLETNQSSDVSKNLRENKGSVVHSSCVAAGNFVTMTELQNKIMTFRDLIDLPPCIGTLSVIELVIETVKDLHELYPKVVPCISMSETEGTPMHQVINSFYLALKSVGDSWMNNDEWMVKCKYEDVANTDLEHVALAMLDDIINLARERLFDMMDEDEETKDDYSPPPGHAFGKAFMESSYSDNKGISSSPATPTSVLPDMMKMSYSPPLLLPLRVQAVGKLNPIDVKRLSFHMFPHVAQQFSNPLNQKISNIVTEEDTMEVGKECGMTQEIEKTPVLDKVSGDKRNLIGNLDIQRMPCSDSLVRGEMEVLLHPSSLSKLRSIVAQPTLAAPAPTSPPPTLVPPSRSPKLLPYSEATLPLPTPPTARNMGAPPPLPPPPMAAEIIATLPPPPMISGNIPPTPPTFMTTSNIAVPLPPPLPKMTSGNIPPPPAPPMTTRNIAAPPTPPPPPMASGHIAPPPPTPRTPGNILLPPPPMNSSNGLAPPPPTIPLAEGAAPPPPPALGGTRSLRPKGITKLKRSSQMGNLYRLLKGKVEGSSLDGKSSRRKNNTIGTSSGGKQGMADALAEITKRSAYFQQIEEDVKNHAKSIKEVKAAIISFQSTNMAELIKFHKFVESHLEKLTDETQVLARFEDFPSKKLEALRMATALYSKLDAIVTTLQNWKIVSPLNQLLDKVENYFNKIKGELDTLERTKDEEAKKFQSHKIQFDFGILVRIKELMVDVSSSCMELALKERREAKAKENEESGQKPEGKKKGAGKLLWRAFQFAFRVYTFAGGHDDRADTLTRELAQEIETDPHH